MKQNSEDIRISVLSVESNVDGKQGSAQHLPFNNASTPPSRKISVLWDTTWKKCLIGLVVGIIVLVLGLMGGLGLLHGAASPSSPAVPVGVPAGVSAPAGATVPAAVVGANTLHSYPLVRDHERIQGNSRIFVNREHRR